MYICIYICIVFQGNICTVYIYNTITCFSLAWRVCCNKGLVSCELDCGRYLHWLHCLSHLAPALTLSSPNSLSDHLFTLSISLLMMSQCASSGCSNAYLTLTSVRETGSIRLTSWIYLPAISRIYHQSHCAMSSPFITFIFFAELVLFSSGFRSLRKKIMNAAQTDASVGKAVSLRCMDAWINGCVWGKTYRENNCCFFSIKYSGLSCQFLLKPIPGLKGTLSEHSGSAVYTLIIVEMVGSSAAVSKLRQAEANGR